MSDENNSSKTLDARPSTLEARWLSREEMETLMKKIRATIQTGESARATEKEPGVLDTGSVFPVEEEERREQLKRQADELLAAERKPEP